jgi:hypothetical protein
MVACSCLGKQFLRDHYAPKFPELESLLPAPLDYARIVKLIGNEMDMANVDLKAHLPSATVMVISVTATTTNGKKLSDEELCRVLEACDVALLLDAGRKTVNNVPLLHSSDATNVLLLNNRSRTMSSLGCNSWPRIYLLF